MALDNSPSGFEKRVMHLDALSDDESGILVDMEATSRYRMACLRT